MSHDLYLTALHGFGVNVVNLNPKTAKASW